MKKLVGIISLFLFLFSLSSCGSDPGKFNDELMASLSRADNEYNTFYTLAEQSSKNGNFTSLSNKGKEAVEKMEKRVVKIAGFKVPKDGEEVKNTTIEYMNIMINSMKGFVSEGELTKSQFEKAWKNVEDNEVKLNNANEKIIEAQRIFAQKRDLELQELPQKK